MQVHKQVGHFIGQIGRAFHRRMVYAFLDQHLFKGRAFHDGLAHDGVLPGQRFAVQKHLESSRSAGRLPSGDPVLRRRLVDYCRMDVELLRDIVAHGRREGFVKVPSLDKDRTVYVAWGA